MDQTQLQRKINNKSYISQIKNNVTKAKDLNNIQSQQTQPQQNIDKNPSIQSDPNIEDEQSLELSPEELEIQQMEDDISFKQNKGDLIKLKKNYSDLLSIDKILTKQNNIKFDFIKDVVYKSMELIRDVVIPNMDKYIYDLPNINKEYSILIQKIIKKVDKISTSVKYKEGKK